MRHIVLKSPVLNNYIKLNEKLFTQMQICKKLIHLLS